MSDTGVIDWGLAARTGARLAPRGPKTSRYTADAALRELADASVRAEGPVREVTGLADGLPVPAARVLDRPEWIAAASESMRHLVSDSDGDDSSFLGGKPGGVQAGAMLAFLSTAILGQYDPFTGPDGTLLLVAPNIVSVERSLRLRPSDFRLWVCLHEVTHRVQFSSSPWLAGYMKDSVTTLQGGADEPLADVVGRLAAAVRSRGQDGGDGGIIGLLRATQAPAQQEALDRLLVLGTLLEGHADHVMDAVGPAVVPSVSAIRKAFDARRTRKQNPVQRVIRALLGMDAKMAQYVRGKAFVDAVVGQVGMERFNTVWTDADTLPLLSEIEAPEKWTQRVLG
ncbi:zinc-dependent metalloprotease [Rhodococcus sp. BP-149]|uniref:zinc-dependent metalloprotease n=1 Tax=unclassified Rhodococcus (in: high G+C Gram-positive bacteria) TaxID=192944 RepID=UPI001C9B4EEF|nr:MULTISPECIES: zinc-dependent metalloprotease [unclassified Rhodococcus (in: high G+C Gram-positive bacteria)]MBY6686732.1 zinc-dependent metalloprotease [Rhodococcus sp. BP-288]MBY6695594.1 zinc-dependent metalloprotease [Rhodococcus sp. BP-188]MBY6700224.1 zinc-dependent metalloprotease [Rhodococcus sp. BP-285]MBY6704753.1 zinc-dependent metalloprotease [Rhodococcus sp. BP-283]MBY6713349.1 zinc-dependent metalloprotease [Rhodococcus sp. BP-160]